jgi:phosphate ABC transporter permease protein PstC
MEQARETWIRRPLLALAFTALASLLLIAVFIIQEGAPFLARIGIRDFLFASDWNPQAGRFGIRPMIAASRWVTVGVMRTVKPMIELLAGIPSVVYGFLGVMVVAPLIRTHLGGPGLSVLAAALILGIMILPTVISIATDAIASVPPSYREGALALGATRWQSVSMVTLRAARSGIVAGVILGMGRALGETMAVIMVAGNAVAAPHSPLDSVRTLTASIALEMGMATGLHRQALFATGIVLFVLIMILNSLAMAAMRKGDGRT